MSTATPAWITESDGGATMKCDRCRVTVNCSFGGAMLAAFQKAFVKVHGDPKHRAPTEGA